MLVLFCTCEITSVLLCPVLGSSVWERHWCVLERAQQGSPRCSEGWSTWWGRREWDLAAWRECLRGCNVAGFYCVLERGREVRAGPFSKAPGVRVRGSALELPQGKLWLVSVLTMRVMKHWNRCWERLQDHLPWNTQSSSRPWAGWAHWPSLWQRVRPGAAAPALQPGFFCCN